jgi:hypothetical protein
MSCDGWQVQFLEENDALVVRVLVTQAEGQ